MTLIDRNIVKTYSEMFEGLSSVSKIELIESLTKSLNTDKKSKEDAFYTAFGAFASDKSAEEIS